MRAARFVRKQRPEVLVLQWWSGTVLHSYLALSWLARGLGTKVVVEFHEVLDPGEQNRKWFSAYVRRLSPRLFARRRRLRRAQRVRPRAGDASATRCRPSASR